MKQVARIPECSLIFHKSICPLCHSESRPHLKDAIDMHYGLSGFWNYRKCLSCQVLFLDPAPSPEFLSTSYDDSYYSYQEFKQKSKLRLLLGRLIGYNMNRTGDPHFDFPGRVLDVGCGSGEFLYRMQLLGWKTDGIELSKSATKIGNEIYGLNIQACTIEDAEFAPGTKFDYIRFNHSFEHLTDPLSALRVVRLLLKKNGLLFIGVPNAKSFQAIFFRQFWWNLGPPVHPFNYCRFTLEKMLIEEGFEVVKYSTNSSFSGILGSLQIYFNARIGVLTDHGPISRNPFAKLFFQWIAKIFDLFQMGDCLEITARIVEGDPNRVR